MKHLCLLSLIVLVLACSKENNDSKKDDPTTRKDEDSVQTLKADSIYAVINLPVNGLFDMDFYDIQGPCRIDVTLYDASKWNCNLRLRVYPVPFTTIPLRTSDSTHLTIPERGTRKISVQKTREDCQGVVPYIIKKTAL